jgi:hypothetical protein
LSCQTAAQKAAVTANATIQGRWSAGKRTVTLAFLFHLRKFHLTGSKTYHKGIFDQAVELIFFQQLRLEGSIGGCLALSEADELSDPKEEDCEAFNKNG